MRVYYRTGRRSGISAGFAGFLVIAALVIWGLSLALAAIAYLFAWPLLIGIGPLGWLIEAVYLAVLGLFTWWAALTVRNTRAILRGKPREETPAPPRNERMAVSDRR